MKQSAKLDSFKLRFPTSHVKILNNSFNSQYQRIFLDTGEVEEHVNLDKHRVHVENGISFRCGLAHYQAGKEAHDCIYLQLNAKMLKEKYFHGITKNTIEQLYNYVQELKIIDIPFDLFMQGLASDVDICYDYDAEIEAMQKANYIIYKNVLPSHYPYVGKPFAQQANTGLMFNRREKATPTRPYCKIYHKSAELMHKSKEFADAHLRGVDFANIGRLEYTIKNSRHKKRLKVHYNTLADLIAISQNKFKTIILSGIPMYVRENTTAKEFKKLGPKDALLHYFLNLLIEKGADKYQIYQALNMFEDEPVKKYRAKKMLDNLIENVDDKGRLINNAKAMDILRQMQLDFLN